MQAWQCTPGEAEGIADCGELDGEAECGVAEGVATMDGLAAGDVDVASDGKGDTDVDDDTAGCRKDEGTRT